MIDRTIPRVTIDPANDEELIQLTYNRIRDASGGTIADFRAGSVVAALVEGQTFAISELLYYLNLLPEAIAVEVFRLYGVERSLGTKAVGAVTISLKEPSPSGFFLPVGYPLLYATGNLVLTQAANIVAGATEITVTVEADRVGSGFNAEPFGVLITQSGLGQVQSIFNREAVTGGSDLEPLEQWIERAQRLVRSRQALITKDDYERAATDIMGLGSRAVAVSGLSSDGLSTQAGNVGLFLQTAEGKPATSVLLDTIYRSLSERIPFNSRLNVFPIVQASLEIEVFADSYDLSDSTMDAAIQAIADYLDPKTYSDGRKIKHNEVAYRVRQTSGIKSVDSVLVNGLAQDYLMAQEWYTPRTDTIIVNLIDEDGNTRTAIGGLGIYEGDI